jgi:polysaccharide biosynthesis/export protein
MNVRFVYFLLTAVLLPALVAPPAAAQTPQNTPTAAAAAVAAPAEPDYVIGPDDVLTIAFWREKDLSGDVTVRPDGRITVPLINDVQAAGYTPEQLRTAILERAAKVLAEPLVTVVVKQINSRNVFITGNIAKSGTFPLTAGMTVMHLITVAGGLPEFADSEHIAILRTTGTTSERLMFNYKDFIKGRRLEQNILLRPGDMVTVP